MITGIPSQIIVQGQTYTLNLNFNEEDANSIDKIWFTSAKLGICKQMTKDGNSFTFVLSYEETAQLQPISTTFNITAQFVDENRTRDMATNISLVVERNENPVTCEA